MIVYAIGFVETCGPFIAFFNRWNSRKLPKIATFGFLFCPPEHLRRAGLRCHESPQSRPARTLQETGQASNRRLDMERQQIVQMRLRSILVACWAKTL